MLTTAKTKTANPPIHMRLRAEHPQERLRVNSLGKRAMDVFRCWSEKKVGFNCLYHQDGHHNRSPWAVKRWA